MRPETVNAGAMANGKPSTAAPAATSADDIRAAQLETQIKAEQRFATIMGAAISLMLRSPPHRNLFLSELEWRILPPLALGQSRLIVNKGMPFAFITWAMANDEVAERVKSAPARLQAGEWNCGSNFIIIDVVAPFGDAERCLAAVGKSRASQDQQQAVPL